MSVLATIQALQTRHRAMEGVCRAPEAWPESIPAAHLPCVLVWPDEGRWIGSSNTVVEHHRTYRVQVFVMGVEQGTLNSNIEAACELLQAFGELYTDAESCVLETEDEGRTVALQADGEASVTDTGIRPLQYGGDEFWGFEMRVRTWEKG
jgi:hypothetical protein